ncbi:RNA-binding protein 34 isoform X2 [Oryzias melastigma]|uniref:RNA binding motif protein 34 n=1 Tax=Oryzias melastigma TaxID=30732 RepID=A0A3B3BMP3_ORYME|nr:RNA-binding protein 34 isoform X2 [Oryzias melastigma]
MKKKGQRSGDPASGLQSSDYVVGQVSGSLFQQNSAASGSLSALFSTAATSSSLLFQPAPKLIQKTAEKEELQKGTADGIDKLGQEKKKKKRPPKESSVAEQRVESRESGLQEADDDEQDDLSVKKKKKMKVMELDREQGAEFWVLKRQQLKARKREEATKTKRTVFVGNLPVTCTKKTLLSLFKDKGSIESIRFRSLVREDPGMSRKLATIRRQVHPQRKSMNAYVVFKEEAGAVKALESNGVEVETNYNIRVDKVTDGSSHDHKRSVFVGNLPFDINEQAFRKHFETCGAVEGVRLVRDQNSGLGKGFGYVLFESADSVELALELNASKLEGRSIRVKRSVKKEKLKNSKETAKKPGKNKSSWQEKTPGRFKSTKKFLGNQQKSEKSSTSFKGEMVDPSKKPKKKNLKKKGKPKKSVHI